MMYDNLGSWYLIMPFMLSITIVFVVLFFYAIASISHLGAKDAGSNPVSILSEKLALGEITEVEYRRKRDLLN